MLSKPIDRISYAEVEALVADDVPESRTLEYKRELPRSADSDKKEFLADVSSFANAGGGDLLFGVKEKDGVAASITGLKDLDEDSERLRLESTIRDGIEPRIPGIQIRTVKADEDRTVLIMRVPRSWVGPHMVTFKNSSRFFSRSSNGKFQMDVTEIRSAFEGAAELPKRIEDWRNERLGRIVANEGPMRLRSDTCLVFHLVPFDSFANPWRFSGTEIAGSSGAFMPIGSDGWDHQLNIDGLLVFTRRREEEEENVARCYTQLFRSGRLEAVVEGFLVGNEQPRAFPVGWFESKMVASTKTYLRSLAELGIQPPVALLLAMTGVKGATMTSGDHRFDPYIYPVNRDLLIFPDLLIESPDCDFSQVLRPVFDSVWNAFGYERSMNYDQDGRWNLQ